GPAAPRSRARAWCGRPGGRGPAAATAGGTVPVPGGSSPRARPSRTRPPRRLAAAAPPSAPGGRRVPLPGRSRDPGPVRRASLDRDRVARRAGAACEVERGRGEQELVAPVRGAVRGQLVEGPQLAHRHAEQGDERTVD